MRLPGKASFVPAGACLGLLLAWGCCHSLAGRPSPDESYPYGSAAFSLLVADSYREAGKSGATDFYRWMTSSYRACKYRFPGNEKLGLDDLIRAERGQLGAIKDPGKKTEAQIRTCSWLHRMIKTVIPRFSLERGFEFHQVVARGERQCFLQSVLIAGILQGMGMDAGVAMVWRNTKGEESNIGHAVTLMKLADGRDIVVDASEPAPFPRHRGLFVRSGSYRFVFPVYVRGSSRISGYRPASRGKSCAAVQARPLDAGFIRSQFYYYRGERAPGGILARKPTAKGLAGSARYLETSVKLCPRNPLAVYMLGRTYRALSRPSAAAKRFGDAYKLYRSFGWVPGGVAECCPMRRSSGTVTKR